MTIVLDVSFNDSPTNSDNQNSAITEFSRKKARVKERECLSKPIKAAKVKSKNERKKLSSASSAATATTNSSTHISIKDSLIENKEKLNDLNDQILNSQQLSQPNFRNECSQDAFRHFNPSHHKSESIMSSDSDIRFTRKKLGDNQRTGCLLIAGFLVMLLVAGLIFYAGYIFLHTKPSPNRIFRGRLRIIEGDYFNMNLTDQNSIDFFEKAREYRERINLLITRSEFRKFYDGSEILALDGRVFDERNDENKDLIVHFLLNFDPTDDFSSDSLRKLFVSEFQTTTHKSGKFFRNLKIDLNDFQLKEVNFGKFDDIFATSSAHVNVHGTSLHEIVLSSEEVKNLPPRTCETMKLKFCRQIGYNKTTFPNLLGHHSFDEIERDLITFREIVDSECFLQSYDFLCHMLQPQCDHFLETTRNEKLVKPRHICREYCQAFADSCLSRIPEKFRSFFDCERFPEQTSIQSCRSRPSCVTDLKNSGQGLRICDGVADCPNLEDELSCSYCPSNALYCGRGRSCVSREMRCDGKFDCPDGSDEKDCLGISPLVQNLRFPDPLIPHRPQFFHEGFAVFSEKGQTGKLCAEGMENNDFVRSTVAESLCKALGYERVRFSEIRNDTEDDQISYVRVLDPSRAEISFVRTSCAKREVFYVSCSELECGLQSAIPTDKSVLGKLSSAGDWPWTTSLFRKDNHVCDGSLVASHWVLTTASCFQGQSREKWTAVFGSIRIGVTSPWTQRRRIIGMVKSPVEGSSLALVRLESPVVYSDFVRPICLPDDEFERKHIITDYPINSIPSNVKNNFIESPHAEKIYGKIKKTVFKEDRHFFQLSDTENEDESEKIEPIYHETVALEHISSLKPEPQLQPRSVAATDQKSQKDNSNQWKQCNTLGWSRQKEHLQRIQLNMISMKSCENISITTVNSLCAEAAYHKPDCSVEEFAGSPMLCLLSDQKRWALLGVSEWRIDQCLQSGTERPRMYDKIESNVSWIREIINSVIT